MVGPSVLAALLALCATPEADGFVWATDKSTHVRPGDYRGNLAIEGGKAPVERAPAGLRPKAFPSPRNGGETGRAGIAYAYDYPLTDNAFQDEDPFREEPIPPDRDAGLRLPEDPAYSRGGVPSVEQPSGGLPPQGGSAGGRTFGDEWSGAGPCAGSGPATPRQRPGPFVDWLWGICVEGWLDQGFTINTDSPRNRSNFPVTFNDRSNEYQMNQLYLVLERAVDRRGHRWDIGGRVDLLYGSDSIFATARGLEVNQDLSAKWNSERYGLALPQCYMEVAVPWGTGIAMKLGHFYTILGFEGVPAVDSFFYSHSYAMQYGEPFTHTGFLGATRLGSFTLRAGMTRGWDNWEDNNNDFAFLGGLGWESWDGRTTIDYDIHIGREQDEPPANSSVRTTFSLVVQHKFTNRVEYVAQYDHGFEEDAAAFGREDAAWYGLNQYLFYRISDTWKGGLRYEWFRDEDATRVSRANSADYFELTWGLNWTPNDWLIVRPSFRWDWVDTPGFRPFADGTQHDQIVLDCDVIMRF